MKKGVLQIAVQQGFRDAGLSWIKPINPKEYFVNMSLKQVK